MVRSRKTGIFATTVAILVAGQVAGDDAPVEPSGDPRSQEQRPKRLDLRVPEITKLYTPEEIDRLLASMVRSDIEEVEVEGARGPAPPATPAVWPAIAAPIWAVLNPTQAWRILAPIPPDRMQGLLQKPDATRTFLEPAVPLH